MIQADDEFDQSTWERRWSQVLRESPVKVANRPPNPYLLAEIADLEPGRAVDADVGTGRRRYGWRGPDGGSRRSTSLATALETQAWDVLVAEDRPWAAVGPVSTP